MHPVTDPLVAVPGISGATELADGRVSLILDAAALVRSVARARRTRRRANAPVTCAGADCRVVGTEFSEHTMVVNASGNDSYVLCELAGTTYALRSDDIEQLEMVGQLTPVPNAPAFVDGVTSVRGRVIPAVSLRARFGFERRPHDLRSRLVVVRVRGALGRSHRRQRARIRDDSRDSDSTAAGRTGRD